MKKFILVAIAVLTYQISFAQLGDFLKKAADKVNTVVKGGGLSQVDVGNGLKEALNIGLSEATDFLSAKDGYFKSPYKILVPAEAQSVVSKLKFVPGFNNVEADLTERMNRAAEDAAVKAKPIFIDAIKKMSFNDAMSILTGDNDAATKYLQKSTSADLVAAFKPIIQECLDKVNARTYWRDAVGAYNKIPFVSKTNPELDDHVTQTALAGMFALIAKKELAIRTDTNLRTSDLLKKVFTKQDKK